MLPPKCPTCNKFLADKQILYETEFDEIVKNQDMEKITLEEADKLKIELLNRILPDKDRYCCRMRMLTYKRLIEIVK
jgi:DNA-directed RNA polymerase subunit N (RpoN/RPB10)